MTKKNKEKAEIVLTDDEKYRGKAAFTQASIEKAGETIYRVDKNACFVEVNDAGCRHLGYEKLECYSKFSWYRWSR